MTNPWTNFKFVDMDKYFVGSDRLFDTLQKVHKDIANTISTSYPPYNIKKLSEKKYEIEIAVAGFPESALSVTLEDNQLIVKGKLNQDDKKTDDYLYKGISEKPFERKFTLNDNVTVNNAKYINGMLQITLVAMIEAKKLMNIPIEK